MGNTIEFQRFGIAVRASPETNDHEVRLMGDGEDLIDRFWSKMIGLDPDDLLVDPSPLVPSASGHSATIARCACGVIGCGSNEVLVRIDGDMVVWSDKDWTLQFPVNQYSSELARAQTDFSWETPDRTAARLVRECVDRDALARNGMTFQWASGRIKDQELTISLQLHPGPYQLLVPVDWDGDTPEAVAERALGILRQNPEHWRQVKYFPQGVGCPPLLRVGWKLGAD